MRQLRISKQITQRTDDSINRYFQEIGRYPMVSAEEEVELSVRIRGGDEAALEKLVLANLRFVISVAKQYQNQGLSFPDLINEGNLGLVKAAQKFDETRGFKFISYAVWWIRQSITQAISEQTRIVRLPINRLSSINKIAKAIPYLEQKYEREPTNAELAAHLELTDEEVAIANDIKKRQISFDMPLSPNGESDFNLYDLVQTGNIPSPDNHLMEESLSKNISRALNKLSTREASILTMSFGLGRTPAYSLHDIACEHNMSTERVRQIKSKSLFKLKKMLQDKYAFLEY
ncbi:sigma-70 family RNA polymerase sigma factor [Gaoshiqia sediminis]|uniref:RNA polymerase sigma factor RpoD/SigA n=1 Tax=Gaoshiqia sediminis TaxID=2986998 RepID=A0AA41Y903_9BACT|nr:RNA polymerase sigma factor RpoD/SigA [Gaoshiqia sediminis]MCW0481420.1 RNA polymerase sigma factor RpoD/SigA [Gaoshiqia sediminis]